MCIDTKDLDYDIRDKNDINDHLKVRFEDVLAEPEGAHSHKCVWRCSYRCFTGAKNCCYRCLTVFCGCFFALMWGCEFACVTFCHVWSVTPCLRVFSVNCGCLQKFWGTALQCFLAPICETMGLCLSRIQVSNFGGMQDRLFDEKPEVVPVNMPSTVPPPQNMHAPQGMHGGMPPNGGVPYGAQPYGAAPRY